jgi:hypothetical protein
MDRYPPQHKSVGRRVIVEIGEEKFRGRIVRDDVEGTGKVSELFIQLDDGRVVLGGEAEWRFVVE